MPGLGLLLLLMLLSLSDSGPSGRQSTPGREWTEDLASCRVDDIPSQVQLLLLDLLAAGRGERRLPEELGLRIGVVSRRGSWRLPDLLLM